METLIIIIFILGYLAITLEHNLKLDKLIPAPLKDFFKNWWWVVLIICILVLSSSSAAIAFVYLK